MDFIVENYLWIVLLIIIILMAIVGYIAEKTEFIKKNEKTVKKPKEKKKKIEQPVIIEDKGIDELLKNANKKDKTANIIEGDSVPLADDLMTPLVSEPIANDIDEPVSADLMTPLTSDPAAANTDAVDQSLFAPLDSTTTTNVVEGPVEPVQEVDGSANVSDDEDIWKF